MRNFNCSFIFPSPSRAHPKRPRFPQRLDHIAGCSFGARQPRVIDEGRDQFPPRGDVILDRLEAGDSAADLGKAMPNSSVRTTFVKVT
jgi:hypothetical protein